MARNVAVSGRTQNTDRPARTVRATPQDRPSKSSGKAGRGFSAMKTLATSEKKNSGDRFSVDYDQTYVIAFLEAENYAAISRHWVKYQNDEGDVVTAPRNCPSSVSDDADCPLCEAGDQPKPVAFFNVVDLEDPSKVLQWETSPGIFNRIVELAEELADVPESKGGPLDLNSPGVYAAVSKKKKNNGFTEYSIKRVKDRDLEEDYDLQPMADTQFDALANELGTEDDLRFDSRDDLQKIVDNLKD